MQKVQSSLGEKFIAGIFFAVFIINFIFIQGPVLYNSYTSSIANLIIVVTCLFTIWYLSFYQRRGGTSRISSLIITGSILLFTAGNMLNDAVVNYLIENDPKGGIIFYKVINYSLNVVLYGCFSVALFIEVYNSNQE